MNADVKTCDIWSVPVAISTADRQVCELIKRLAGRKQNVLSSWPTLGETRLACHNRGKYSSRCTYTKWEYTPMIRCFAEVAGDTVSLYADFLDTNHTIRAPRGYHWAQVDGLLALVRTSDGYEYHPDHHDLLLGARHCQEKLLANRQLRKEADKAAKHQKREQQRILKSLPTITVTLADSRRAGNCDAGTHRFARLLGVDGELNGKCVRADKIMQLAERTGQVHLARRAVNAAWERLTTVSI